MNDMKTINPMKSKVVLLCLSVFVIFADQLSKYLCTTHLMMGEPVQVFPGFDLLLLHNSGAAFSFLSDAGGWQQWLLSGISIVVSCGVLVWLLRLPKNEKLLALALAFILGGAIGNLYDRLVLTYVIDFISVYYGEYRFAVFNIADSAISVGFALMVLDMFLNKSGQNND